MNFSTSVQLMFALKQPFPILIYICLFCFFYNVCENQNVVGQYNKTIFNFPELKNVFCVNICHDSKAKWTLFRV